MRRNFLPREQLGLAALVFVLLLPALDWGLPHPRRMALLTHGIELSTQDRKLLSELRETYYRELETKQSSPRPGSASPVSINKETDRPFSRDNEDILSDTYRYHAFRSFIIGTVALDERKTFSALARMNPRNLDPGMYIYGGAYLYPLGTLLFAMKTLGILQVTTDFSYYLSHPQQIARLYVTGRTLNLMAFIGTLLLLGLMGIHFGNKNIGTLSMAIYACSTLPLSQTLVAKPHIYAGFWGFLGIYLFLLERTRGQKKYLYGSAVSLGLAVGSALPSALLALIYPILLWERRNWKRACAAIALAWGLMGLIFLITNPYVIWNFTRYVENFREHGKPVAEGGWGYGVFYPEKLLGFCQEVFCQSYCFPISLLGILGVGYALYQRQRELRRLAIFFMLVFGIIATTLANARIALFIGPWLCLFSAIVCERFILKARWNLLLRGMAVGLLFLPGLLGAALFLYHSYLDQAWYKPAYAFVQTFPFTPATTVGVYRRPEVHSCPPLPLLRVNQVNISCLTRHDAMPTYVIIGNLYPRDRELWEKSWLRPHYKLLYNLGYQPSYDWLPWLRVQSESRLAAWIYQKAE